MITFNGDETILQGWYVKSSIQLCSEEKPPAIPVDYEMTFNNLALHLHQLSDQIELDETCEIITICIVRQVKGLEFRITKVINPEMDNRFIPDILKRALQEMDAHILKILSKD